MGLGIKFEIFWNDNVEMAKFETVRNHYWTSKVEMVKFKSKINYDFCGIISSKIITNFEISNLDAVPKFPREILWKSG